MSSESARRSFVPTFGAALLGAIGGALLTYAHFSGRLNHLYHRLGWHALAGHVSTETSRSRDANAGGHEHAGAQPAASAHVHDHAAMQGMEMPEADSQPTAVPGHVTVTVSAQRQQLIGVKIGKVVRDRLVMSIRAVGIIEPDQTRLARVQTRVQGWVTKVHVNYVGQDVKRGDPLLDVYSPELLSTQQEYLIALAQRRRDQAEGVKRSLAQSALRRLQLLGVPDDEIAELEKTQEPRDTLTLRSPITGRVLERNVLEGNYVEPSTELYRIADLSVLWLQAKIYEYELPHIQVGQTAVVSLLADPTSQFEGKIAFVEPIVQELTRTVKVRVEIPNPDDLLKPGMYADLKIEHDMGEGLLVPDSAVLRTGERAIAFRALEGGRFEPVAVALGGRFGDRLEIRSGLAEGDHVLVSGNFLIDSESQLKASAAGGGGHHHQ